MDTLGYIHSYTTGSVYDGPGLRTVIWTAGCQFRCQYCHNPDTWHLKNGQALHVSELVARIRPYTRFARASGGGVTVSGGEPLVQAPFVRALLRELHASGIHTALDTNGFFGDRLSDDDLSAIDLVLLDLKSWEPATHRRVAGAEIAPVLRFARRLAELGKPAWVRFVVVPGLTDDEANIGGLAEFVATLPNVSKIELLPFHQMGRAKWRSLNIDYPLEHTPPADERAIARARSIFRERGLAPA